MNAAYYDDLRIHLRGTATPECVLVLCHGYGAPGDDLVPVAELLCRAAPTLLCLVPEAPETVPGLPGSSAWWNFDFDLLMQAFARRDLTLIADTPPPNFDRLLTELQGRLQDALERTAVRQVPVNCLGFSQGGVVALALAPRINPKPSFCAAFSTLALGATHWLDGRFEGLRVLMSHGDADAVVPLACGHDLQQRLESAGAVPELKVFSGGHTLSMDVLAEVARLANAGA